MKSIVNKIMKNKLWVICGLIVGIILTNVVTYGASELTSDGVSYTKDGKLTTVKQALDDLITKSSKVDDLEKQIADYKKLTIYLADNVKVGDYVAYDAGSWDKATANPSSYGNFGGNAANTNKGKDVLCYPGQNEATLLNGWRVLEINQNTKTVTLVHAGTPECYYHSGSSSSEQSTSINNLNGRGSQYVNQTYATKGRSITKEDVDKIDITSDLRSHGVRYWLASAYNAPSANLWYVYIDGRTLSSCVPWSEETGCATTSGSYWFGFRPVVELKANIKTTGKGTDMFGNPAWILA